MRISSTAPSPSPSSSSTRSTFWEAQAPRLLHQIWLLRSRARQRVLPLIVERQAQRPRWSRIGWRWAGELNVRWGNTRGGCRDVTGHCTVARVDAFCAASVPHSASFLIAAITGLWPAIGGPASVQLPLWKTYQRLFHRRWWRALGFIDLNLHLTLDDVDLSNESDPFCS
jgi:hypothetical protein